MPLISRNSVVGAAMALVFLLWTPVAFTATCRISAAPLNFGIYNPGSPAALDAAGDVEVDCRGSLGIYLVTLSAGTSGNATNRYMSLANERLYYNIYLNAARTRIWGDGAGPTSLMFGLKLLPGRQIDQRTIYGRVFPLQQPSSGTYVDSLVVTVLF